MVRTENLKFAYPGQGDFSFPDISLPEGEQLLILGESGIGKTTLLHLLAGLLHPKSGKIELAGTDISRLSSHKMDQFRAMQIGMIFQRPHFISALSLQENLQLVQYLAGIKPGPDGIRAVSERLGLGDKLHQKPHFLSQGEQQRAVIAMALINQPSLILADEPTSALDDKNCEKVAELLTGQASYSGANLVVITHDQRLKAYFKKAVTL